MLEIAWLSMVLALCQVVPTPVDGQNDPTMDSPSNPYYISEAAISGSTVVDLNALDPDGLSLSNSHTCNAVTGSTAMTFSDAGVFAYDPTTAGTLKMFDVDAGSVVLTCTVTADDGVDTALERTVTVSVTAADEPPWPTSYSNALTMFDETVVRGENDNSCIWDFNLVDDEGSVVSQSIMQSSTGLTSDWTFDANGCLVNSTAILDYESMPTSWVKIRAADSGNRARILTVTLSLTNVNEAPVLTTLNDVVTIAADTTIAGDLLYTAQGYDPEGRTLSWTGVSSVSSQKIAVSGGQIYSATNDWSVNDAAFVVYMTASDNMPGDPQFTQMTVTFLIAGTTTYSGPYTTPADLMYGLEPELFWGLVVGGSILGLIILLAMGFICVKLAQSTQTRRPQMDYYNQGQYGNYNMPPPQPYGGGGGYGPPPKYF